MAIVGMSCRFAGCSTPAAFWNVVASRRSCLTALGPDAEMPVGQHNVFTRPYPVRMGQLGPLFSCVPSMQNFPRQVNAGENQDLYFATQLAFDALADAGMRAHGPSPVRGSVRVGYAPPFNASTVNWLQHTAFLDQTMDIIRRFFPHAPEESLGAVKEKLVESLPAPNASSFLLGAGYRFASWIARECSFAGVATTMDAGLLTGAAVLNDAMADLFSGQADVALAGALTPPIPRAYLEGLSGEVLFSTRAELHPFAQDQDGTIPGEGGAFFVLKRRSDALRDHDRIYALVRSVAIGHNPDDDPSFLLAQATDGSGIPVRSVGLIEADGSGIAVAERREIDAVQKLWGEHRPGGPLVAIGSVKGNFGHTLRASMSAGVVKAALALYHRVLPPQVPPERTHEALSNLSSSAYLLDEARPWITGDSASPRRAAVLGANFDATDPIGTASRAGRAAAVVLEEEPEDRL
ncbi:MAG: polyketide synthase [Kiritimatiellae bacterium]|nr:polyketide synthase [Kiritimatiellia bacterium]